jgi:hypothetical protein
MLTPTPQIVSPTVFPTPAPTLISTKPSSVPTVRTPNQMTQIPVMPEASSDGLFDQLFEGQGISYKVPVPLEVIEDFYQESLINQDWDWIYTDIGQGLSPSGPTPILAQEFKRGKHRLAFVAIENFPLPPEDASSTLIMSTQDISSGETLFFFSALMSAVFPPQGLTENADLGFRQFTSNLLQFEHPALWFPTRMQMITFPTDIAENKVNILQRRCASDNEVCFVNFMLGTGSTLYQAPVSIRVYPVQAETTLENFDALRWTELTNTVKDPLATPENIEWPEDLTDTTLLETIEIKPITLRDGTPALQRLYRWRQVKLSIPLVSSYTLFKRNDTIIEFHTDFTTEEWVTLGPDVQATILSIEVVP